MNVLPTSIPDVKLLIPNVYKDDRGFFLESYNRRTISAALGVNDEFVQDNHSRSAKNVLRGLHYQLQHPQGKMVRVIAGEVYDVAVDLRKSSPTFGKWAGVSLSGSAPRILWVPKGFAHGFLVLSDYADVVYKTTDYYDPSSERTLRWDDPDLGIPWPSAVQPRLSAKDLKGSFLKDAEVFP